MTQGARRLIEQFDVLPEQERSEVLKELETLALRLIAERLEHREVPPAAD